MTKTALIYVRKSGKQDPRKESVSVEVQEAACRALPEVKACDEVVVYKDEHKSGRKARVTFEAMVERIREGGVSVVAYYDQSRAFRSVKLFIEFRTLMNEPANIDIPAVPVHGERFARSPTGRFAALVLAGAHEMEAELAAEKIRDAYRALNAKGIATGMATYGYRYVNNTRTSGAMQPDPEQAPVVRRIFELYADGSTTRQIAQTLTDEGIRANSKRGWLPDTVGGMLSNITYTGRTYSGSRRDKTGDIIQASWPAIVDDGLFQRVQDRMKRLAPLLSLIHI